MSAADSLHVPLADDWSDSEDERSLSQSNSQSVNQSFSGTNNQSKRYCTLCCRGLTRRQLIILVFIIAVIIIVMLAVVFTVIIPRIIQSTIDQSEIKLSNIRLGIPYQSIKQSIKQSNYQSNGESIGELEWYIPMTAEMAILNAGPFSAILEPMTSEIRFQRNNQSMDQSISPLIGTLDLPEIHISGDTYQSINQSMRITNQTAFDDLMKSLINLPSLNWLIDCSGTIDLLSSLTYPISISKSIPITGMNGLNNVTVESFSMDQSTKQSINVNLTINLFNPGQITIQSLGDLHFGVLYPDPTINQYVVIGNVWAYNVSMLPQSSNQMTLTGSLINNQTINPSIHSAQQALIQSFLQGLPSLVQSINQPINETTNLFAAGLDGLTLDVMLPGNQINLVNSLVYQTINLSPSSINQTVVLDADVLITINNPLGQNSLIDLTEMSLIARLMHNDEFVGWLNSPMTPVHQSNNQSNNQPVFESTLHAVLDIASSESFEKFVSDFVIKQSINLSIDGTTSIQAYIPSGLISVNQIPIQIQSNILSMDGLHAVEQDLTIVGPRSCSLSIDQAPYCGELVTLTAALANPSTTTVELTGSMFDMWFDSVDPSINQSNNQSSLLLGSVSSSVLVVRPGQNIETLTGALYPASQSDSQSIQTNDQILMGEFIDSYLHGKPTTVRLVGLAAPSLPPNSSAAIAARAVNLTALVPGQNVADRLINNMEFQSFHIDFGASQTSQQSIDQSNNGQLTVDSMIAASFQLPSNLRLSMNITSLDLTAAVLFSDFPVGELIVANQTITHIHGPDGYDTLYINIVNQTLKQSNNQTINQFEKFATALVLDDIVEFSVGTHADPTASTALGVLHLHNVTAMDNVTFKGLNSFQSNGQSVLSILSYTILNASPDWLIVECSISIASPSNVSMSGLGEMLLDLYAMSNQSNNPFVRLGRVRVDNFALPLGTSYMTGIANLTRPTDAVTNETLSLFISNMIDQTTSEIDLHGLIRNDDGTFSAGTSIDLLKPAISALVSETTFPGLKSQFIVSYQSQLTLTQLAQLLVTGKCSMSTQMEVNNPFDTYIAIGTSNIDVFIAGTDFQMGSWIDSDISPPILIEPNSVSITEQSFLVDINLSGNEIQKLYDILNATIHGEPLYLDSVGSIETGIAMQPQLSGLDQSFVTSVHVDARHVPCVLKVVV